jgi:N-acetyl-gamma-glutamyl-phosphate reductase
VIRAGIVGATGYGGRELLRLFANHPEVKLTAAASTSVAGQRLDAVLPAFRGIYDIEFASFDAAALAAACDVVFIAVPSKESMEPVAELRAEGVRVIDIGPDFRLKRMKDFIQYYGTDHRTPHLAAEAVYGLPPWYREKLKTANLVAVPGCYPISIILPLRPLLDAPLSEVPVVVDSISGIPARAAATTRPTISRR